jgi:hypothetical protein
MKYAKVMVAKVALSVASKDEMSWVNKLVADGLISVDEIQSIAVLSKINKTMLCLNERDLIEVASKNKISDEYQDHLISCERCAKIGQQISAMINDAPLQLSASLAIAS